MGNHSFTQPAQTPRIDLRNAGGEAVKAMYGLEHYVRQSGLEASLLELVRMRASQINGCAYCMDMHSKDARAAGETEQRLFVLPGWREAPFYTDRERAALAWTEGVTRISPESVEDELYRSVREHFSEQELIALTMAIVSINGWNRLAISLRAVPGTYQPAQAKRA